MNVEPGVERASRVLKRGVRRQRHRRNAAPERRRAEAPDHLPAIDARQREIADHDLGAECFECRERVFGEADEALLLEADALAAEAMRVD